MWFVSNLLTQKIRENDFLAFVKTIWPEFIEGAHHKTIADKFNKLASGEIKRLIVKPVKRITGFASVGFLLVVLLILALIFLFIGIIKIMQGIGLLLGINPTGFAFASIGLLFLIMALRNYWRRSNG